jgi:hypothetical protein
MMSIYRTTGFMGVVGLVGPNPERAGELASYVYALRNYFCSHMD